MQSILQYRASRQQVQRQFERELLRQPTPAVVPNLNASSTARYAPPDDINNPDDVEKATLKAKKSSEKLFQDTALGVLLVGITIIDDLTHGPIFVVAGPNDRLYPHNWSLWATVLIGAIASIVGWASSIDSGTPGQDAVGLHVGLGLSAVPVYGYGRKSDGSWTGICRVRPVPYTWQRNL